jgi:DNA-binding transcriptional ArsR family regulator
MLNINRTVDSVGFMKTGLRLAEEAEPDEESRLDAVFAALSDPVRRTILMRLDGSDLLVSEIAAPFAISLQAVSRHIQVLVRAGLIEQHRTGRISRCSLVAGPIYGAAIWINRYSKYWQEQFDLLAMVLDDADRKSKEAKRQTTRRARGRRSTRARGRAQSK